MDGWFLMTDSTFSYYNLVVTAGPGHPDAMADVEYFDQEGRLLGTHGLSLIGFCSTWKDLAWEIRRGLQMLGLDSDPISTVSPMVDLS